MRNYWTSALVAIIGICLGYYFHGVEGAFIVAILGVLEVSVSFDNAVFNAKILQNMSVFWQNLFLWLGILIAVVGVRLLLPVLIVAVTANLGFMETANMVFNDTASYSKHLDEASTAITAFGGMFLLMIFLDFLFDSEKEHHWLGGVERLMGRFGEHQTMSSIVALVVLISVSMGIEAGKVGTFLFAGVFGIALYFVMGLLKNAFEDKDTGEAVTETIKRGGFMSFLYLEVVDASFSLDGVIGAFAMSNDPIIIMLGLAIGAWFVRSITIHLVRAGVLAELVYLEHGAHYAIGVLAAIMLCHNFMHVPEMFTGLAGAVLIALAIFSSFRHKKAEESKAPVTA
ncbi:DUF475 domain-containing protein [Pseudomonas serbica]|jgi:hypothetical protein|uniref:DUF475 domain-containing protein n=1 Tax=Pseudomonas serbica TaxID=2965074 RepID=UPI00237B2BAA|nr:DUF475 domain-containing protein [Pseudomonas serbica]